MPFPHVTIITFFGSNKILAVLRINTPLLFPIMLSSFFSFFFVCVYFLKNIGDVYFIYPSFLSFPFLSFPFFFLSIPFLSSPFLSFHLISFPFSFSFLFHFFFNVAGSSLEFALFIPAVVALLGGFGFMYAAKNLPQDR